MKTTNLHLPLATASTLVPAVSSGNTPSPDNAVTNTVPTSPGRSGRPPNIPKRIAVSPTTGTMAQAGSLLQAPKRIDVKELKRLKGIDTEIKKRQMLNPASPLYRTRVAQGEILKLVAADLRILVDQEKLGTVVPNAINGLSDLLRQQFPPQSHAYVMLGNSTAALMGWMALNYPDAAMAHLAIGGIASPEYSGVTDADHVQLASILHAHIDKALLATLATDKTLVLVDYVSSGKSLVETAHLVKRWLATKSSALEVKVFGYAKEIPENFEQNLLAQGFQGRLVTASGQTEKAFSHMNETKLIKKFLQLRASQSGTLKKRDGKLSLTIEQHPQDWERTKQLLAPHATRLISDTPEPIPGWE